MIVDVDDYGADPTGIADSTNAIQDAIDTVGTAVGGGTVLFPSSGEYLVATRTGSLGQYWCLDASYDDLTLEIDGTVVCDPVAGAAGLFFIVGGAKKARAAEGNITNWGHYWLWEFGLHQYTTLYDLEPTSTFLKGATSVTLDTAADANNITVGDWIGIRTGEMVDASQGLPDGELQMVTDSNPATGVITVEDPLKTSYAREYFVAGTVGRTSTSVTANPAPFAIGVATDRLIYDTAIRGNGTIDQRSAWFPIYADATIRFEIEGITAFCTGYGLTATKQGRYNTVSDCTIHVSDTVLTSNWAISADSTSTDYEWTDSTIYADAPIGLHINEGAGRVHVDNVDIYCPSTAGNYQLVGVYGRGYDHEIENCYFEGGGETAQIYVETGFFGAGTLTGWVHDCQFSNTTGAVPFSAGGTTTSTGGWVYEPYSALSLPVVGVHGAGKGQ